MHPTAIVLIAYGIIVLAGGIFGYAKAKSVPSLISGVIAALVVIIAAVLYQHHPRLSLGLGTLVGLILTVVMGLRFRSTKKPIPAIPVAALSFLVFLYSAVKLALALSAHKG